MIFTLPKVEKWCHLQDGQCQCNTKKGFLLRICTQGECGLDVEDGLSWLCNIPSHGLKHQRYVA